MSFASRLRFTDKEFLGTLAEARILVIANARALFTPEEVGASAAGKP